MEKQAKPRLVWFDANRVCAAVGVVLIHCTTDFSGGVFPDATPQDRVVPVFLRSIAEFSGSEMFFFFSLKLSMVGLRKNPLPSSVNSGRSKVGLRRLLLTRETMDQR